MQIFKVVRNALAISIPDGIGLTGNRYTDSVSLARSAAAEENVMATDGMRSNKMDGLGRNRCPSRRTVSCLLLPPMRKS